MIMMIGMLLEKFKFYQTKKNFLFEWFIKYLPYLAIYLHPEMLPFRWLADYVWFILNSFPNIQFMFGSLDWRWNPRKKNNRNYFKRQHLFQKKCCLGELDFGFSWVTHRKKNESSIFVISFCPMIDPFVCMEMNYHRMEWCAFGAGIIAQNSIPWH